MMMMIMMISVCTKHQALGDHLCKNGLSILHESSGHMVGIRATQKKEREIKIFMKDRIVPQLSPSQRGYQPPKHKSHLH